MSKWRQIEEVQSYVCIDKKAVASWLVDNVEGVDVGLVISEGKEFYNHYWKYVWPMGWYAL